MPLEYTLHPQPSDRHSVASNMLVLAGAVLVGLFITVRVSLPLVGTLLDGGLAGVETLLSDPARFGDHGRILLLTVQGLTSLGGFVIGPLLYLRFFERRPISSLSPRPVRDWTQALWTALLVPVLLPLLELTVSWNKSLHLPAALAGLERWAAAAEATQERMIVFLLAFSDLGQFALGLLVVAVLPAICEELFFRGMIQPLLLRATGSPHRAIWVTAIVFSAIHFQFFGFVPRMLLGALFGYIYYWSGNLRLPMLAHFVNNGLTVTLSYFSRRGDISLDPDKLPEAPLPVLLLSAAVGAAVLYRFRERYFLSLVR